MQSPTAPNDSLSTDDINALKACRDGDPLCGIPRWRSDHTRASLWDRRLIRATVDGYELTDAGREALRAACGSCGGTGEFPVQSDIATYVDCGACS